MVYLSTTALYFEIDCNASPNFEDYINKVPQMWMQNQILIKAIYHFFQTPNTLSARVLVSKSKINKFDMNFKLLGLSFYP